MKQVIFSLLAVTALMMGQDKADIIQTKVGATGAVPMVPGVTYTITGGTFLNDVGIPDSVNTWEVGNQYTVDEGTSFMIEFSSAIPANFVALRTADILANSRQNVATLSTVGGSSTDFQATRIAGSPSPVGYNPPTGVLDHSGDGAQGGNQIWGNTTAPITKLLLDVSILPDDDQIVAAFGFNKTAIAAAVPEPSSLLFMGLIVTGVGMRRRYVK